MSENNNETLTNLQRLQMELRDINIPEEELEVYLMENDLTHNAEYDPTSNTNKKAIYKTTLSVLESIANSPQTMKNYKTDDISITHFHTNLERRIENLQRKINNMVSDEMVSDRMLISYICSIGNKG